ncbi:MAG: hypothetical protein M0P66_06745 [Salinivirgaceae bacterium]|nr:hypothetical protein [Salinivirgaceae bacterium]
MKKQILISAVLMAFAVSAFSQTTNNGQIKLQTRTRVCELTGTPQACNQIRQQSCTQLNQQTKSQKKQMIRQKVCDGTMRKQMTQKGKGNNR